MARTKLLFPYHVEFPPYANPPDRKGRFEADLMAFIKARRLRCLMGQHGGLTNAYGVIHRKRWGVKEADRIALGEWIRAQNICATVKLGRLEEDNESTDLCREITECVFEVDNLTRQDRKAAAAYATWIKNIGRKPRARGARPGNG